MARADLTRLIGIATAGVLFGCGAKVESGVDDRAPDARGGDRPNVPDGDQTDVTTTDYCNGMLNRLGPVVAPDSKPLPWCSELPVACPAGTTNGLALTQCAVEACARLNPARCSKIKLAVDSCGVSISSGETEEFQQCLVFYFQRALWPCVIGRRIALGSCGGAAVFEN
jgi:hypothetical protein